jgi:hypothetical protein
MFTKNIFNGNTSSPEFRNAVTGSNTGTTPANFPQNEYKWSSMGYMPFYKFDAMASPPNTYDIVMKFYETNVTPNLANVSEGGYVYGFSQLIAAQWDKECVNLNLYNRKMIYNQDFVAGNTINIQPQVVDFFHQLGDNSFAEPIVSDDKFTIESGVVVHMNAGNEINFKPGFEIKQGATLYASINPIFCNENGRFSGLGNNDTLPVNMTYSDIEEIIQQEEDSIFSNTLRLQFIDEPNELTNLPDNNFYKNPEIYPNPTDGLIRIESLHDYIGGIVEIFNTMGNKITSISVTESTLVYHFSGLTKGLYLIKINHGQKVIIQKVIYE